MLKLVLRILLNQAKIKTMDSLIEILLNTIQEFRRAQQNGQFDVNRENHGNAPFTTNNVKPNDKNPFASFKNSSL